MKLCMNRPEGFGPESRLSRPLATTCFFDTIVIPLPVWIYILALPTLYILTHVQRHSHSTSTSALRLRSAPRRTCLRTSVTTIFYLLIIANILMHVLEIVRLSLINYGLGLLPFAFVALLLVLSTNAIQSVRGRIREGWLIGINTFVLTGLCIVSVFKTVGLVLEQNNGEKRIGSKYPVSDQLLDVAVMAGVYLALAVLEVALGIWKIRASTRRGKEPLEERDTVLVDRWAT